MSGQQKLIIAVLFATTLAVMTGFGCAAFLLLGQQPALQASTQSTPVPEIASPTFSLAPVSGGTPIPPTVTQTSLPTPTGTKVVVVTVQPTPTPTRANCLEKTINFEDSGLLTGEQVTNYLRQTVPAAHLDNCWGIEYVNKYAADHGIAITGNIVPGRRIIYVYATDPNQNEQTILDTLTHEVGHNVHMNLHQKNRSLILDWNNLFEQSQDNYAHNQTGFVSDYARANWQEDFAESYLAYIRYPEILQLYSPQKYEFMRREVFQGKEFLQ